MMIRKPVPSYEQGDRSITILLFL